MLDYVDQLGERRTGAGVRSAGVDPEVLQNQTATGVQAQQSQQQAKLELMIRNIAEIGLRDLFAALLINGDHVRLDVDDISIILSHNRIAYQEDACNKIFHMNFHLKT
jgi:hypothetical protein